jgi:hypothetical protein
LFLDGERSAGDFVNDWLEVKFYLILLCVRQHKQHLKLIIFGNIRLQM